MQIGRVDLTKLRGIAEKAVGLGKETLGVLLDDGRLQDEGEAQQERAAAELRALELMALREDLQAEQEDTGVLTRRAG